MHERHSPVLPVSLGGSEGPLPCSYCTCCHSAAAEISSTLLSVAPNPPVYQCAWMKCWQCPLSELDMACLCPPHEPVTGAEAQHKSAVLTDPLVKSSSFDSFLIKFQELNSQLPRTALSTVSSPPIFQKSEFTNVGCV